MAQPAAKAIPLVKLYRDLYPWASLNQFVDQLIETIAYQSEDKSLIALNKPFGVGTYTVLDHNRKKTNQDKLLGRFASYPRYCVRDALDGLTEHLNSPRPYQVLKSIDRYMSGLILITNDQERHRANLLRAFGATRSNKVPPYGMRAITCGYPILKGDRISEKIGCELVEVDELGDHKEPIITQNPGSTFEHKKPHKRTYQVEMLVKKINQKNSTSLVEIYVSKLSWDIARCYISSKTSFILGDVRFSKRIREVLGKKIQVSAFRSSHRFDDQHEPLSFELRKALGVSSNAQIPLMLDLHELRLKNYCREGVERDLIIKSPYMPLHFVATARSLNLI